MDRLSRVFKSKIVIFVIQMALLSLFIYFFNFKSLIKFDADVTQDRQIIIQFLANFVIFTMELNGFGGFLFIFLSWTIISLIPVLIFNNYKKAWSMNLITFFLPNFFFYVFYARYSKFNFNLIFPTLFLQTILIGLYLIGISIFLSIGQKRLRKTDIMINVQDLNEIIAESKSKCPYCGTEFESVPKYCYNCSKQINSNEIKKA